MPFVVYWLEPHYGANHQEFTDDKMGEAMQLCEVKRKAGMRHVTMSSEMAGQVGKPGVDAVEDGKTPDGEVYDWSKAHRAGKTRRK